MTALVNVFITLGLLVMDIALQVILQKTIDRYVARYKIGQRRNLAMHKVKTIIFHSITAFVLVLIWGVNLQNAWVSIAGFLGLVAIGFFAVWSVLSNLFAGFLLLFTRPFQVDDTIEFFPDGIKGKVKDINSFFIILTDEEGDTINIPNNMVYQKIVRRLKSSTPSR